jgi:hypothetical protein
MRAPPSRLLPFLASAVPGFTVLYSSPVLTPRTRTNLPPSPQPPTPPMTV